MEQGELQISPFRDKCNACNMALCQIVNLLLRHKDSLPVGVVYCVERLGSYQIFAHSVFFVEIIPKWDCVRKCVRARARVYSCSSDCINGIDSMSRS